jgi:hypothetical protein
MPAAYGWRSPDARMYTVPRLPIISAVVEHRDPEEVLDAEVGGADLARHCR